MNIEKNWLRFALFLIVVFIMLSLYSWKAETCFAPDELFYYKGSQTLSDIKNLFGPQYYGEHRFQKPPLFYLIVFISFKIFGLTWFAARLPTILSGILVLVMTYLLGLKLFDDKDKAFFGTAFLSTCVLFFRFGHIALPEVTFIFFAVAAIYFAYRALLEKRKGLFYISFVFMAIGSLVKGPIAFIVPCVTVITFCIIYSKKIHLLHIPWIEGILIILAFNLLWLVPSYLIYGKAFFAHIQNHELNYRVFGQGEAATLHNYFSGYTKRTLFYLGSIFTQYLPWSLLAPLLMLVTRKDREKSSFRMQRSFLIIWLLTGFLVFVAIASIRFHYVLSLFPALSLVIASFLDFSRKTVKKLFTVFLAIAISVYIIVTAALMPLIFTDGVDRLSIKLNDLLKVNNAVCAVSWRIDYQKVQLHIDRPIHTLSCPELVLWEYAEPGVKEIMGMASDETHLFYAIVAREEYDEYFNKFLLMAEKVVKRPLSSRILSEDQRWRKKIRFTAFLNNIIKNPRLIKDYFKETFQEGVLLVDVRKM